MIKEMIGIRKEIKNQNQKFLPMLFAKTPATVCGISITHNKSNSGIN
jgi:hypothetical protein